MACVLIRFLSRAFLSIGTHNVMQHGYCLLMALIARSLSSKSIREAIDYLWQGGPRAWLELIVGTAIALIFSFGLVRFVRWVFDLDTY